MTVSLEMLKEFVASIACKADATTLADFVVWLDVKICEYKLTGEICWESDKEQAVERVKHLINTQVDEKKVTTVKHPANDSPHGNGKNEQERKKLRLKEASPSASPVSQQQSVEKAPVRKLLECRRCCITFQHMSSYARHRRTHHDETSTATPVDIKPTTSTPHRCAKCRKSFLSKYSLQTHRCERGKSTVSTGNRPLGYSTLIGENNKSDKVDSRVKKSKEYVNLEDDSPSAVQSDDSDEVIVVKDSLMENDKNADKSCMIEDEGSQSQQDDAQDLLQNSNDDYTTQHEEELMIADMKKNYQELFLDAGGDSLEASTSIIEDEPDDKLMEIKIEPGSLHSTADPESSSNLQDWLYDDVYNNWSMEDESLQKHSTVQSHASDSSLQPTVEAIDVLDNTDPSSYLQLKPFKRRPRIVRYEWATNEVDNHPYTETQLKPDVFKIGGKIIHGCRICGQTFACQTSFARHRRVHVGKPLHTCETCGKHFYRKDHYSGHKCRYSYMDGIPRLLDNNEIS